MTYGHDHAFPVATVDGYTQYGMTKRELLAAMAMQGLLSSPDNGSEDTALIARWSVDQADALIDALDKATP